MIQKKLEPLPASHPQLKTGYFPKEVSFSGEWSINYKDYIFLWKVSAYGKSTEHGKNLSFLK